MNRELLQALLTRRTVFVLVFAVVAVVAAFATLALTGSGDDGRGGAPGTPAGSKTAKEGGEQPLSVLADKFRHDGTTIESCLQHPVGVERTNCRVQALANIAFERGPDAGFAALREASQADPAGWAGDSHIGQHGIGTGTLARFKNDIGAAIAAGGATTNTPGTGGYLHGILLVGLRGATRDDLPTRAAKFCDSPKVRGDSSLTYWCLHGMGHAMMIYTGNDLKWALQACDTLASSTDEYGCYIGAFMENYGEYMPMTQRESVQSKWLSDDDVRYPCNAVPKHYREACYIQIMIRVSPQIRGDFRQIPEICRSIEPDFQATCYRSAGTFSYDAGRGDALQMARLCQMLDEGVGPCTTSAVGALIGTKDPSGGEAATVCQSSPASIVADCWSAIGGLLRQRDPSRHAQACTAIAAAPLERSACMRAGAVDAPKQGATGP